jgi:hypothetical protein
MALSRAGRKKLGRLAVHADRTVREVILERGGNAGNVRDAGHWADKTLAETADAAVKGERKANAAIKIAKQAEQKGQRRYPD